MKKRKVHIITKIVVITLVALAVLGFALNWFMTNRLEKYLRSYLTENVSDLTNGFYHFTFDSLSVGLFDGELSIKGIEMHPDSTVLAHLKEKDSVPDLYLNIKIAAIDLKGINLVWRLNYRDLGFKIFEIKSPNIQITQKEAETKSEDELIPENSPKDLYDIISPYFDQISVKTMNLENATIIYNVDKIDNTKAMYGLRDANLRTYNFILNKNSNIDSRFLYCDDIIFEVAKHQTIIDDNHFKVETDHLEFSTRDSLILIKGVKLTPHDSSWVKRLDPGNYIDARVDLVEIKGMSLTHKNNKTEFLADSFKISNSHIICFTVSDHNEIDTPTKTNTEEKPNPWTLYDLVSPVLSKVAIQKLAFEEVVLEYSTIKNGQMDNFTLQNFNFHADHFILDSLSTQRQHFWHCEDYIINASGIKGRVNSKNYGIAVNQMLLDTQEGKFQLKGIELSKLDSLHNENRNYVTGSISSVDFTGIDLKKGLSASNFTIQNPKIELYIVEEREYDENENHNTAASRKPKQRDDNIWNLFVPYADYFSVKNININNANVAYHNLVENENLVLKRFYFYAKDFLVNDKTRQQPNIFYTCSDFGFQFSDFDNLLPGKNYRLQIKQAGLSHIKKELVLNDVVLTPQEKTWKKAPDTYFSLSTPLIRVEAKTSVFDNNLIIDSLSLNSIKIDSPHLEITQTRKAKKKDETSKNESNKDFLSLGFLRRLSIGTVEIDNANINYKDATGGNSFDIILNKLNIDSVKLCDKESISLEELTLTDTRMDVKHDSRQSYISMPSLSLQKFRFGTSDNPMPALSALSLNIPSPTINIDVVEKGGKRKEQKPKDSKPKDRSELLADITSKIKTNIAIDEFSISDANISFAENGIPSKNEIGATSFRMDGLKFDAESNALKLEDLYLSASNLRIPISKGFYTLIVDKVSADSKRKAIEIDKIHLLAKYPKEDFAHKHPKGTDWFDVKVGNVTLSGLNIAEYLANNQVHASYLGVHDVTLDNYKNQKVVIQHNKMPLIYTAIQNAPIKFSIDSLDVTNFSVDYQELPTKGDMAGTILFKGMNGRLKDFTNIATEPEQLMNLHADGVFMNSGKFDAVWKIPVSKDYDRFFLDAHLYQFSLSDLNQILIPLGSAEINSGYVDNVWITMDATSEGASSTMLLLYNDLSVSLYKDPNLERPYKFVNKLIPLLIKKNNPNKPDKKPRRAESTIVRDKYHSTFNYFWQILQPPLIQSVGVSEKKQRAGKKIAFFMSEVKNFFHPNRKKKKQEEANDNDEHLDHSEH